MITVLSPKARAQLHRDVFHPNEYYCTLIAGIFLSVWVCLPQIRSSFWLDETAMYWAAKDGWWDAVVRSYQWSGHSPLYALLAKAAISIGGTNEVAFRMPSLLGTFAAVCFLHRLGERIYDSLAGMLAGLAYLCIGTVAFAAIDARPYAIGLAGVVGSSLMFIRWIDTGRLKFGIGYLLLAAMVIYSHYFLICIFAVQAIYYLHRKASGTSVVPAWEISLSWFGVLILASPLMPQLFTFFIHRRNHTFAAPASFGDVFDSLAPSTLLIPILFGIVYCAFAHRDIVFSWDLGESEALLLICWAVLPPVALFAASIMFGVSLFLPRYYIASAPGCALLAAMAIRSFRGARVRPLIVMAAFVCAILAFGSLRQFGHGSEDWRGALAQVERIAGPSTPVLLISGFVEANGVKALEDPRLSEVLFSPALMYARTLTFLKLPFVLDGITTPYVQSVVDSAASASASFLLVGNHNIPEYEYWMLGRLADQGFTARKVGYFGNVSVVHFTRGNRP